MTGLLLFFGFTGALPLLIMLKIRYGSHTRAWVRLSREQKDILKETYHNYDRSKHPAKPKVPHLYNKGNWSADHELEVYPNGLKAVFCLGAKGKYRFIAFDEISAIFNVNIENPDFDSPDSDGVHRWKSLQIETNSGLVAMGDSRIHDLETLIPILREQLSYRWREIYHPETILWTDFKEGGAYIHSLVRQGRIETYTSDEKSQIMAVDQEVQLKTYPDSQEALSEWDEAKGELLLEESEEDRQFRAGVIELLGKKFVVVGGTILFGAFFSIYLFKIEGENAFLLALLGFVLGGALLGTGIIMVRSDKDLVPIRIYKNGINVPQTLQTPGYFIKYDDVISIREKSSRLEGQYYELRTNNPRQTALIRHKMRGLEKVISRIKEAIGEDKVQVKSEFSEEIIRTSRRMEHKIYLSSILIGSVIGFLVCLSIVPLNDIDRPLAIVMVLAHMMPFAVISLGGFTYAFHRRVKYIKVPYKIKTPVAILGILTLILIVTLLLLHSLRTNQDAQIGEPKLEQITGPSSLGMGSYNDENLTIEGPIIVQSGETLSIFNSSLIMNLTTPRSNGIRVESGGTLFLVNTSITSSDLGMGYYFEILGSTNISHCFIEGLWGDKDHENLDGGLEIYSSNVKIDNTTIHLGLTNGILVVKASPLIIDNTISECGDDGVEIQEGSPVLRRNTIEKCDWAAIIAKGSSPYLVHNTISHNRHGIGIENSDPHILNNTFVGNREFAIRYYHDESDPVIENNQFIDNEEDILEDEFSGFYSTCTMCGITSVIFCGGLLARSYRKQIEYWEKIQFESKAN